MPKRIQRKRRKGWRIPEGTVYVGRPTKWGDPHNVSNGNFQVCVDQFREHLERFPSLKIDAILWLRGKD